MHRVWAYYVSAIFVMMKVRKIIWYMSRKIITSSSESGVVVLEISTGTAGDPCGSWVGVLTGTVMIGRPMYPSTRDPSTRDQIW